jgi:hypothetical protein
MQVLYISHNINRLAKALKSTQLFFICNKPVNLSLTRVEDSLNE